MSAALKKLIEARGKATEGEWRAEHERHGSYLETDKYDLCEDGVLFGENADFIALAANSIEQVKADYDRVVEALKKYADKDNWGTASYECAPFIREDEEWIESELTGGKLARETLKDLGVL